MSFCGHHSCLTPVMHPLYPTLQIRHPCLLWAPMLPYWDSTIGHNGGGFFWLTRWPGLGQVAGLTFPGLHWGLAHSHVAYVINAHWTASGQGCEVGDYVNDWVFIVTMMGSDYERTGWVLSVGQSGVAEIQLASTQSVQGGDWSSKYAIVENLLAELKSCSMHVLSCHSWCCHCTTHPHWESLSQACMLWLIAD